MCQAFDSEQRAYVAMKLAHRIDPSTGTPYPENTLEWAIKKLEIYERPIAEGGGHGMGYQNIHKIIDLLKSYRK
jgi:hypothetical protein